MLDSRIVEELRSIQQRLTAAGALPPPEKLNQYYWLEFKNDEEFPAIFGSISGGGAHPLIL